MYVKVQVGHSDSLRFLFDTGGEGVLIDSLTAENAGLDKANRLQTVAAGAGGSAASVDILHQKVGLPGKVSLKDVDLTLMNLTGMNAYSNMPVSGIMGYDLFVKYVTLIDFEHSRLLLYKKIGDVDTAGYKAVPFTFDEGVKVPRIPVAIILDNGESYTGHAIFDSGANTAMLIFAPFSNFYGLQQKVSGGFVSNGQGLSGANTSMSVTLKSLTVAGYTFGSVTVPVEIDDKAPKQAGEIGLLGIQIIKKFNVILDYQHSMIYFKPIK